MACLLRLPQLTNTLKCGMSKRLAAPRLLLPPAQHLATKPSAQTTRNSVVAGSSGSEWRTIYRLPLVRLVAGFNRLKVYQAILTAISTPAAFALGQVEQLPPNLGVVVAAIGVSGLLTLSLASWGAKNLVGFIYINEAEDMLKFAYVDYWGRRQNVLVAVDDLVPLWDQARPSRLNFYQSIRLRSDDKLRFKLLQRFGIIVEPSTFVGLFGE